LKAIIFSILSGLFFHSVCLSQIDVIEQSHKYRKVNLKNSNEFMSVDIGYDTYFLKNEFGVFLVDTDQTSCEGYQSFTELLKILDFKKLEQNSSPDDFFWSAFGVIFPFSTKSCETVLSHIFSPPRFVLAMDFQSVIYATSEKGNQQINDFVTATNLKTFYTNKLKYVKPDFLQCEWEIYTLTNDDFLDLSSGPYFKSHKNRMAMYSEAHSLSDLLRDYSKVDAIKKFLMTRGITVDENSDFLKNLKETNKFVLSCDLGLIFEKSTYKTYFGNQFFYSCDDSKCSLE
jgi:hypothetical protein